MVLPQVPCFVFGEKWMYSRLNFPEALTDFSLKYFRVALLIFWCVLSSGLQLP